jgi:hypothetical protein
MMPTVRPRNRACAAHQAERGCACQPCACSPTRIIEEVGRWWALPQTVDMRSCKAGRFHSNERNKSMNSSEDGETLGIVFCDGLVASG